MKRKTTNPPREKSKIVSLELKIHQMFVTVYFRRRFAGDKFVWKSYQGISLYSLRRLARLAPTAAKAQKESRDERSNIAT